MILIAALITTAISIGCLLLSPINGVLVTVMFKPLIDASWQNFFFGFNCLQIISIAVPLLILPRIIQSNEQRLSDMPLTGVAIAYLISNIIGTFGIAINGKPMGAIEYFFRVLNGFLGFFMFAFFFNDRKKFGKLLLFMLLAGVFPMMMGVYQALTGKIWQMRQTAMGMTRYVGLYHDAFSIRAYGFQTLTAIFLSWVYFTQNNTFKKALLLIYGAMCCFVIYKSYSKAAVVIFAIWIIIWSLVNKKFLWALALPAFMLIFNLSAKQTILQDTERLFIKEIRAYEGTMDNRYVLGGRAFIWEHKWKRWIEKDAFQQFFGSGENPPAHNEYLRILYCNGILGVVIYVIILSIIGWKLLENMLSRASPINVMGVMVFAMWILDTIGLTPGMYPAYQWYIWGFITLALKGVEGLEKGAADPIQIKIPRIVWKTQY